MNERRAWYAVGIGVGGVFASIAGWTLGAFWHDASAVDYLRVMGLTFIGFAGIGIVAYESPEWWAAMWWQISRAESLRLDAATFRHKREHLIFPSSTPPEATGRPTIDATAESWRVFYVDSVTFCLRALSGDPLYKGGMDRIMDFSVWRKWADPLVREGILDPIFQGARTRWADTWSAARVLGKLESGWLPTPLPQETAPVLKEYNGSNT